MIHPRIALLSTFVLLGASTVGNAVTVFTADLRNDQEPLIVGPSFTNGAPRISFGTATLVLNDAMTQLTMTATISGIDVTGSQTADTIDNLVAAHIHASATAGTPTFGVVWGFFGSPDNDTNPKNTVLTPFATGAGGTFVGTWDLPEGNGGTTLALQLPNILAGRSYLNFHTTQNPGGEIRGTLVATPEPSSIALAGIGLIGLIGYGWLRPKRKS